MRDAEKIAVDALRCALSHGPDVRLIGNVTAREVARLAAVQIMTCPSCGAEAWVSIDCDLCLVCSAIGEDAPDRDDAGGCGEEA